MCLVTAVAPTTDRSPAKAGYRSERWITSAIVIATTAMVRSMAKKPRISDTQNDESLLQTCYCGPNNRTGNFRVESLPSLTVMVAFVNPLPDVIDIGNLTSTKANTVFARFPVSAFLRHSNVQRSGHRSVQANTLAEFGFD